MTTGCPNEPTGRSPTPSTPAASPRSRWPLQHLEFFGKVEVTRRPGSTGGRNLPNIYRIIGEEFNWEPTPKEPREPGQIFAAYRRRHAEIEAEHRRTLRGTRAEPPPAGAGPAPAHRGTRGQRHAPVNGHAPRQGEEASLPKERTPRQPGGGHPDRSVHLSHPRTLPSPPSSPSGTSHPSPAKTIPPASLPNCRKRRARSWIAGRRLSLRTWILHRILQRKQRTRSTC